MTLTATEVFGSGYKWVRSSGGNIPNLPAGVVAIPKLKGRRTFSTVDANVANDIFALTGSAYGTLTVVSNITGATAASPCVLTVDDVQKIVPGQAVTIAGMNGTMGSALNGNTYYVKVVDYVLNKIDLYSVGSPTWTAKSTVGLASTIPPAAGATATRALTLNCSEVLADYRPLAAAGKVLLIAQYGDWSLSAAAASKTKRAVGMASIKVYSRNESVPILKDPTVANQNSADAIIQGLVPGSTAGEFRQVVGGSNKLPGGDNLWILDMTTAYPSATFDAAVIDALRGKANAESLTWGGYGTIAAFRLLLVGFGYGMEYGDGLVEINYRFLLTRPGTTYTCSTQTHKGIIKEAAVTDEVGAAVSGTSRRLTFALVDANALPKNLVLMTGDYSSLQGLTRW